MGGRPGCPRLILMIFYQKSKSSKIPPTNSASEYGMAIMLRMTSGDVFIIHGGILPYCVDMIWLDIFGMKMKSTNAKVHRKSFLR